MDGHRDPSGAHSRTLPPTNVRLLTSDAELAAAVARAEEGAKRLHDRLAARAARDEWMAEHSDQRVGWRRFVHGSPDAPSLLARAARPVSRAGSAGRQAASSPPAA